MNVHCDITQNSQKVETTQISTSEWMYDVMYPYNGILFVNNKDRRTNAHYSMDEPWVHYRKSKKPVTKEHVFYDFIHMKFLE